MHLIISGPWGTLASAFFFLSSLFGGDLLVLRGCLLLAYAFLLINGIAGLPAWPWAAAPGRMSVDMIIWSAASGVLHGCAVLRMLLDELPVRYATPDDAQVALFFSRRSGMEPLEAKEVLKHGSWLRVPAGQRVVSSVQLYECVYLLVEGRCTYASPCCPSAPASPIATPQRYPSGQLLPSPKALPAQLPMVAQALGGTSSYALQDSSHHSSSSDRQAGRFFLSLTRNVSLEQRLPEPCACAAAAAVGGAAARAGEASSRGAVGVTQITDSFVIELPEAGAAAAADQSARRSGERSRHSLNLGSGITPAGATGPAGSAVAAAGIAALSSKGKRMMRSGHIFSLSALNVFGVYIGFDQYHGSQLEVWAETDCLLYTWPMSSLERMATACSPSLAAYWRNFVTYSIASEFELRAHKCMTLCRCSTGELEHESWLQGVRSRDFTDPVRDYESPHISWQRCKRWLARALSPFPPAGMRHTALPLTGVMARTRAMAVAEAKAQAARSRDISIRMQQEMLGPQPVALPV